MMGAAQAKDGESDRVRAVKLSGEPGLDMTRAQTCRVTSDVSINERKMER